MRLWFNGGIVCDYSYVLKLEVTSSSLIFVLMVVIGQMLASYILLGVIMAILTFRSSLRVVDRQGI